MDQNQLFVSVTRTRSQANDGKISVATVPAPTTPESFYLAINQSQLGERYFLSAFMRDAYPKTLDNGAAASLGTQVVTFQVRNGRLMVFDAQDGRAASDTFDPTLVVESYPIIEGYKPFEELSGHDKFILFDPAAGLNNFGLLADAYGAGSKPSHVSVDASYTQRFRHVDGGATFEQVFAGTVTDPTTVDMPSGGNEYRVSGTLGIAFRKYNAPSDFKPTPAYDLYPDGTLAGQDPPLPPYFFTGGPLINRNEGTSSFFYNHWNIHPGMKPIVWKYSPLFAKAAKQFPGYDIVGAVKRGIENWNDVFGFQVLQAEEAGESDSFGDDDSNYLIYDGDPTYAYAFANWRENPNTGEIRGASVYFNSIWLYGAIYEFDQANFPGGRAALPTASNARPKRLTWGSLRGTPLCAMPAPQLRNTPKPNAALMGKSAVETFITHVIVHEIGHTLGLRHNFKGSLVPTQSSVMEYIVDPDAVANGRDKPGTYDIAAIKLLYGMSTTQPTDPFCTDEDTDLDPLCAPFDTGADPLHDTWAQGYAADLPKFLDGTAMTPKALTSDIDSVANFLRLGTPEQQVAAWAVLDTPIKLGAAPKDVTQLDAWSAVRGLVLDLFLATPATISASPELLEVMLPEVQGFITNSTDKVPGTVLTNWETRRKAVDVLKALQDQDAFQALQAARTTVAAARGALSGSDAAYTDDLLARIDAATHPYYDK